MIDDLLYGKSNVFRQQMSSNPMMHPSPHAEIQDRLVTAIWLANGALCSRVEEKHHMNDRLEPCFGYGAEIR